MFQYAFAGFKAQIQTVKLRVALFQTVHHAQALQVVLETAVSGHAFVQRVLPGVTKRCVAQVVRQGDGFDQIFMQTQSTCE